MDSPARSRSLAGPIVMLIGGAVTIVGSLLDWGKVSLTLPQVGNISQGGNATSGWEGKTTIACGIVLILGGVLLWLGSGRSLRRGVAIIAILAGLAVAGTTIYDIATKDSQANQAFRDEVHKIPAGASLSDAQIDALREQVGLKFSLQFGIVLTLIGGAIGLVGGAIALAAKEPEVAPSAYSAPDMPPTGPPGSAPPPPPPAMEPDV